MISEKTINERHELLGRTFHIENVRQKHWGKIAKMNIVMGIHQVYSSGLDRKLRKVMEEEKVISYKSRDVKTRLGNNGTH